MKFKKEPFCVVNKYFQGSKVDSKVHVLTLNFQSPNVSNFFISKGAAKLQFVKFLGCTCIL